MERALGLVALTLFPLAMLGRFILTAPADVATPDSILDLRILPLLKKNLVVVLVMILGGLLLALPTVFTAAWNAFMTGTPIASLSATPRLLLPPALHGIPEVAGQVCATLLGFWIAAGVVRPYASGCALRRSWFRRQSRKAQRRP